MEEVWEQPDLTKTPKVTINLKLFFDKSGSMRGAWSATLSGVVEYFEGLIEQPGITYKASLYAFGDKCETIFKDTELKDINYDDIKKIRADGISTALYDSVGFELTLLKDNEDANLIVVFTDGADNSSHSFKPKQITELRETLEAKGNFTFVFMGASPDVWSEAQAMTANNAGGTRSFAKIAIPEELRNLRASTNRYSSVIRSSNVSLNSPSVRSVRNFYEEDTNTTKESTLGDILETK